MTPLQDSIMARLAQNREALKRLGVQRIELFGSAVREGAADAMWQDTGERERQSLRIPRHDPGCRYP